MAAWCDAGDDNVPRWQRPRVDVHGGQAQVGTDDAREATCSVIVRWLLGTVTCAVVVTLAMHVRAAGTRLDLRDPLHVPARAREGDDQGGGEEEANNDELARSPSDTRKSAPRWGAAHARV